MKTTTRSIPCAQASTCRWPLTHSAAQSQRAAVVASARRIYGRQRCTPSPPARSSVCGERTRPNSRIQTQRLFVLSLKAERAGASTAEAAHGFARLLLTLRRLLARDCAALFRAEAGLYDQQRQLFELSFAAQLAHRIRAAFVLIHPVVVEILARKNEDHGTDQRSASTHANFRCRRHARAFSLFAVLSIILILCRRVAAHDLQ